MINIARMLTCSREVSKSVAEVVMQPIERIKQIFADHGGIMRTAQLSEAKIYYKDIQTLLAQAYIEKLRYGYYQWTDSENGSEVPMVTRLFPDGILCMDTALFYHGYSDRTPAAWHLAVSKNSGKSRFKIDYPFVKPYFVADSVLELGLIHQEIDGYQVRIYDKERCICDCLRYVNQMDREIFNKAIRAYIQDTSKNIPNLLNYTKELRCSKKVKDLIGVWF